METTENKRTITAIVTCFNKGHIIEKCLDALMEQQIPLEIIVINDCSTDNSAGVIDKYSDLCTVITHQCRKGACAARNTGLSKASGEYIIFIDGDMILSLNILIEMKQILDESDNVMAFVYGNYERFGDYSKIFKKKLFKSKPFNLVQLCKGNYVTTTSLVRRDVVPLWDEKIERLNDWDFWLTICLKGYKGIYLPKTIFTAYYKAGDISISAAGGDGEYTKWANMVAKKHYEMLSNNC